MRTTLDIDDDVLFAAKELARRKRSSAGRVLSELARRALELNSSDQFSKRDHLNESFLGFEPFFSRGAVVTNDLIDKLREEPE